MELRAVAVVVRVIHGEDVSSAAEIVRTRALSATVIQPRERAEEAVPLPATLDDEATDTTLPAPADAPVKVNLTEPTGEEDLLLIDEDVPDGPKVYSREELEAIADKDGIQGLRDIGNPLNVKATAIDKLIEMILLAQEH